MLLDVTKKDSAMNDRVIDIEVKVQRIGSKAQFGIRLFLFRSYNAAVKMLPPNVKFEFYTELMFVTDFVN